MNHLVTIGQKLLEGVMFHSDTADSFQFLGLEGFAKWQNQQMENELEELNCLKKICNHPLPYAIGLKRSKARKTNNIS